MLGARIYIDFTKYDFEECTSRLKKELTSVKGNKIEEKTGKNNDTAQSQSNKTEFSETQEAIITKIINETDSKKINGENIDNKTETKQEKADNNVISEPKKIIIPLARTHSKPKKELSKTEKSSVYYWTEIEVNKWLNDQNIKPTIIENISPCDGKLLDQLFQISKEVPEFFFSSLRADSKASLKDVAYFTSELKSLFS